MDRMISRIGLVGVAVTLGGCVVAAPVDDYSYYDPPVAYGPPAVVVPPPVVSFDVHRPYVERHYVHRDRVIVRRPSHRHGARDRHRRHYDRDRYDH